MCGPCGAAASDATRRAPCMLLGGLLGGRPSCRCRGGGHVCGTDTFCGVCGGGGCGGGACPSLRVQRGCPLLLVPYSGVEEFSSPAATPRERGFSAAVHSSLATCAVREPSMGGVLGQFRWLCVPRAPAGGSGQREWCGLTPLCTRLVAGRPVPSCRGLPRQPWTRRSASAAYKGAGWLGREFELPMHRRLRWLTGLSRAASSGNRQLWPCL